MAKSKKSNFDYYNDKNDNYHYELGVCHLCDGHPETAIPHLVQSIVINKENVFFSYTVDVVVDADEEKLIKRLNSNKVKLVEEYKYEIPEALSYKLIREIDGAYKKETLESDDSNITLLEITYRYIEKWQDVADEYYKKLIEYEDIVVIDSTSYSADDFHEFIKNMKTNWERYNTEQCENYDKVLYAIYGGSMISLISAEYRYEAQKDWALQLVSIYEQL